LYGFIKMVKREPMRWVKVVWDAFLYSIPFSVNPLLGFTLIYFLKECPEVFLLLLPLSRNLPILAGSFIVAGIALQAMRSAGKFFTVEKEPEEGDIPAEVITEDGRRLDLSWRVVLKMKKGEIKPIHSIGADGLTKEDVLRLKEMGIRKIKVKEPLPLVPFIGLATFLLWIYMKFFS
jgi:hypothetical protein